MTEKITIKLTIAGDADSLAIKTARWLQRYRHRAIAVIQEACQPEILAHWAASTEDIDRAKLEALAYHEYCANILCAQLYGQRHTPPSSDSRPIPIDNTVATTNGNSTLDLLDLL
jgi:hypothetical protein